MENDSKHRWKDKLMEGHHQQRFVDLENVRTSISCRTCDGRTLCNKTVRRLKGSVGGRQKSAHFEE